MVGTRRWSRPGPTVYRHAFAYPSQSHPVAWQTALRLWTVGISQTMRFSKVGADSTHAANRASTTYEPFEAFFHHYEHELFGYLWRMTGDEQAASDLCQETFLPVWQHFTKVSAYERPVSWLFRVATNLALNHLRLHTRHTAAVSLEDLEITSSDLATQIAEGDAVRRTLMRLVPRQRAALVLREVYGLSCQEVAHILGISRGATKILLWRSRDAFRELYLREGSEL